MNHTPPDGSGIGRRELLAALGGSALAASLAGCSSLLDGDTDGGEGAVTDVPDEPIEAGLQTFTEGPGAVLGLQTQYGAELAVQRINEAGGVAGRQINLDVSHEVDAAVENYTQWVSEGKEVTFGPTSSGNHEALAPEVESQGVVNVGTDGTVTTLYEESVPDPTYSFRFQNYDVMEATAAARVVVDALGAENVETVAGINPNYSFGQDQMRFFTRAIRKLTGAEVVYEGYPDLLTDDMSTHITEVNNQEPDVTFTSAWGGDVVTLLTQAVANGMFENTRLVGSILYSAVDSLERDVVERADAISGSRNYYWNEPAFARWSPNRDLFEAATSQFDISAPTTHFMSGYGAVAAWATAAEKAVDIVGGWPSQEAIARTLEGHGFFTPAGYHVMSERHQGISTTVFGDMTWDDQRDIAALSNVQLFSPPEVSPPPGTTAADWIDGW